MSTELPEIPIPCKCYRCAGTGIDLTNGLECPLCYGLGYTPEKGIVKMCTQIKEDIISTLPGATKPIYTYQILEVTDSDEYTALDANKKAWYNLFISAGVLDMSDGTKARDLFLAWIFPPGKLTYTALMAIL